MNCRFAEERDTPELKQLWMDCFGEEEAYAETSLRSPAYRAAVLTDNSERICSMLLIFPATLCLPDKTPQALWYVYAFCTAADCRSKGYGRALLTFTEQAAAQAGCCGVYMVPGEPSLFQFYGTLGYQPCLTHRIGTVDAVNLSQEACRIRPCTPERYAELREQQLAQVPHIAHPVSVLAHQQRLAQLSGADLFELDGQYPAVVETWDGETAAVKELLLPEGQMLNGVAAINSMFHMKHYIVCTVGEAHRFGVLKWLGENQQGTAYAGLAFD